MIIEGPGGTKEATACRVMVPPAQVEPGGLEVATAPEGRKLQKIITSYWALCWLHSRGWQVTCSLAGCCTHPLPASLGVPATSSARDRRASASFLPTNIAPNALHQTPANGV